MGTWYLYWRCLQGENEIYYYGVDLTSSRCQYPVCSVVWSVSTVINDVDDYWHGVEVWLLWHLTSSLVNISPSLGTKHPVSRQRVNIISSSFTSERERLRWQLPSPSILRLQNHKSPIFEKYLSDRGEENYISRVDMEQIDLPPTTQ